MHPATAGDPDFTTAEQLYIDPRSCIDCSACEPVCPVDAISADYDLDEDDAHLAINADYFTADPTPEEAAPSPARLVLPEHVGALRVAIIGTGPSALYAATELSEIAGVDVTLIERLPTPFGLVRYGVAPDHPATKRVSAQFRAVLTRPNVTCLFHVEVGRDVSLEEVAATHEAVIWAAGAAEPNRLAIPGESLPGVHTAGDFVAWYNGHPDHADDVVDLSGTGAVLIGNGNVALDVARVLARPHADLARTDIADHALVALANSRVTDILVAARKGPHQAACSLGELEALSSTPGVTVRCEDLGPEPAAAVAALLHPNGPMSLAARKLAHFTAAASRTAATDGRTITFSFGLEPRRFEGSDRVSAVVFERMVTEFEDGRLRARGTGEHLTVPAELVLTATGYRSGEIEGLPFDKGRGTVSNIGGRVTDGERVVPGLYCTGWARRGSSGMIGTNRTDAAEVVRALLADAAAGLLARVEYHPALGDLVADRGVRVVDARGWNRIDEHETARGRVTGRPRVKVVARTDLVHIGSPEEVHPGGARP
jgi:ferredoxin--NADP+ reductase